MKIESKYKAARNLLLYSVMLFMLGLSSVFPQAASASPGDLFVSTAGSGLICTQADPCDLATAMLNAQDGDQIYFAAGIYTSTSPAVLPSENREFSMVRISYAKRVQSAS